MFQNRSFFLFSCLFIGFSGLRQFVLCAVTCGVVSLSAAADDFLFSHEQVLGTTFELTITCAELHTAQQAERRALAEIDRLESIFDPFVQAKAGQDGTGLGLAIAHRLVGLMGGALTVTSIVGEGSRFRFAIPMQAVSESWDAVTRVAPPEPAPAELTALIVDDSDASRALLGRQVARLGVPHRAVASGAEALDALSHRVRYTSVLLDLDMPGMDGFEVAAAIRGSQDARISRIPIIALTTQADQDLAAKCRAAAMDGLITKPVDLSELRDQFERLHVRKG